MNWPGAHAFLAVTFLIHLVVFLWVYRRKGERRSLLLCGTFLNLFLLYVCKYYEFDLVIGIATLQSLFRILAGAFTTLVLYLWWKAHRIKVQELSWVGRSNRRSARRSRKKVASRFGKRDL